MKVKNILLTALVALGTVAAAHAQLVTVGLNDLVLGFNKTSGTGSDANLEVVLGNISNFKVGGTYATGSEVFLSQLSVADLNSTYGTGTGASGWKSSVTNWTVVGTNGAANTLWAAKATAEAPGSDQGQGASAIATMYNGLNNHDATANSATASVVATAETNSWKNTSSGNFGYFTSGLLRQNNGIANVGTFNSLNLYEMVEKAGAATLLGTFKLYNDGGFSFTSALVAIPEPSTYAALLGLVTLGVVAVRRRRQAALEL